MSEIVAEAVRAKYARAYEDGYTDAVKEMLLQLEGHSTIAPAGSYTGPVPDELREWIAAIRKRAGL